MSVEWTGNALDRLADLYTAADPIARERIAAGAERINTRLADDPWTVGESRDTGQRVWFARRRCLGVSRHPV